MCTCDIYTEQENTTDEPAAATAAAQEENSQPIDGLFAESSLYHDLSPLVH